MPFKEPYPSAIATLTALETLLVIVTTDDGAIGFGEAAIVEGYTHETRHADVLVTALEIDGLHRLTQEQMEMVAKAAPKI